MRATNAPDFPGRELFDYELPPELIAQEPVADREASRLLVVDRARDEIREGTFRDLPDFLRPGDLLVRNDAKVVKARVHAVREDGPGTIEILFHERLDDGTWRILAKPARKLKPGTRIRIGNTTALVTGVTPDGGRTVELEPGTDPWALFERHGELPLPPYVERAPADPSRYQTTYARSPGAVAAPTAGFHFTPETFQRLEAMGVLVADVTLHVGPGTFLPIRTKDPREHRMHREHYELSAASGAAITAARAEGRRIIPVGSTSMRVLETVARAGTLGGPARGSTDIFLLPGSRFEICSAMITNFHLPRTTLILLVMAFGGVDLITRAYREAIRRRFRFYSFGDAMLIL